jgi:hypothetical protein
MKSMRLEVRLPCQHYVKGLELIILFTGARFDDGAGGDNEVQRTMLELINQLDGFDPRGNIKVLMATNRYCRQLCTAVSLLTHSE